MSNESMKQFLEVDMLLTICVMLLSLSPFASADEWTKNFEVQGRPKLRVETSDANIRVTTGESKNVSARVTTEGWKIGGKLLSLRTGDRSIRLQKL